MALEFSIEIDDNGTPKLRKFQKETKKTGSVSETASKAINAIGKGLAVAGAAAAVAGGALFTLTKGVAESRDRITKMGRELGVATEFLSGMGHAAALGGSDLNTFQKGMARLSRTASDAQAGLSTAARSFSDLGINVEDSNGVMKTNDQLLFEVADKFKSMPDGVLKAAKAQEIFGRAGKDLINTLNQGSDALRNQIGEAQELGIAFSQEAGEQAELFNDTLLRLQTGAQGALAPIGEELIPVMTEAFGELQTAVEIAGPAMLTIFKELQPAIEGTLDLLVDTAQGWAQIAKEIGEALDFEKELQKMDDETTEESVKNTLKRMEANDKEAKQREKAAEKAEKQAERTKQQKELNRNRAAEKRKAAAEREAKAAIKAAEIEAERIEKIRQRQLEARKKEFEDARLEFEELERDKVVLVNETEREISLLLMSETERRKFLIEEEFKAREAVVGKTIELETAKSQQLAALEEEQNERRKQNLISQFDNISQITSNVSGALTAITQAEQNNINRAFEERGQKVEDFYNNQIKAAEGNADQQEKLQRERDEKLRRLGEKREKDLQRAAKRTAEARKRAAQLETAVNTAAAVTKALPNIPLSIAVGLQGAAQLAFIETQQFFKGGMTEGNQQMISVGENGPEFVVSSGGTRAAGEAALEDINNGRLEDAANKLTNRSNGSGGGLTLNLNGGIIDEQFLENTLLPKLRQFERRF